MASKAQASLAKIIAIISTVPKPDSSIATAETRKREEGRGRGLAIDIDLNLEVGPEEAEGVGPTVDHSVSPAESAAAVLCSSSSSDPTATSTEIKSECCNDSDDDNVFDEKKKNGKLVAEDGYIDLLLEAARELESKDSVTPAKRSSPPSDFVQPKRGRNRAMPLRYRDSVLDPWGKPPPMNRLGRAARN